MSRTLEIRAETPCMRAGFGSVRRHEASRGGVSKRCGETIKPDSNYLVDRRIIVAYT